MEVSQDPTSFTTHLSHGKRSHAHQQALMRQGPCPDTTTFMLTENLHSGKAYMPSILKASCSAQGMPGWWIA